MILVRTFVKESLQSVPVCGRIERLSKMPAHNDKASSFRREKGV
jgi:hypothetical protein